MCRPIKAYDKRVKLPLNVVGPIQYFYAPFSAID